MKLIESPVLEEHKAMLAQEFVLRQRADIVHALCRSGSSEYLESVLDILLSQEQLTWEDYQNILVPGRSLHTNARQLLDLVFSKGVETCLHLTAALKQVLPKLTGAQSIEITNEERATTSTHALVTQRARLVRELKDSLDGLLDALVASGHFSSVDCDEVNLPIRTPLQQVRTLLDLVLAKGEDAAHVVVKYAQQQQTSSLLVNESELRFPKAAFIVLSTTIEHCTIPRLFKTQDPKMTPFGSTCFHGCLSSSEQQQKLLDDRDTTEAKHQNMQITAMFLCGLLSQRHQCLWFQCCSSSNIVKRAKLVTKCLSKALQKHFKSIPQPVQGEKKSMHAMPGFVWLIKCIYEMQENTVAKDAMSKMDVQHLKLTYCNIGPVECTALAYVLQHLKNPVGLQLDYNSVGDVGIEQLLPCLHICQSLYLRNNNISDEGISKLITKGILCENFQKIALFNNKLTDNCMKYFSELLKNRQNFLALRLGNNNISAEGAEQLAEGLKRNHSLQHLGLWGNKIGDTGARALACALENSKSLLWLSLVGNGVGSVGAFALASVIRNCTSLEDLWLTDNCITRPGVDSLTEALQHNVRVKSVWLKNNHLSKKDEEELKKKEPRLIF